MVTNIYIQRLGPTCYLEAEMPQHIIMDTQKLSEIYGGLYIHDKEGPNHELQDLSMINRINKDARKII